MQREMVGWPIVSANCDPASRTSLLLFFCNGHEQIVYIPVGRILVEELTAIDDFVDCRRHRRASAHPLFAVDMNQVAAGSFDFRETEFIGEH